jgi:16S rRNA (uracil1498-N3)-methyltransferase
MRLTRIYQQQPLSEGETLCLSKEASHHLVRVLRLAVGAEFILFNGEGGEFKAKIIALAKNSVVVQIGKFNPINRESPVQTILVQSVLRPEKMDYTLQKAAELGVTHIVPLITERCSLFKLSPERWQNRLAHWQAILINACEQSGRTQIPTVTRAVPFKTAITEIKADMRVILMPNVASTSSTLAKACHCVAIFVGPEGGWSEAETQQAMAAAYLPLQLGPRVLRTETAGLVALTLLQTRFGDISLNLD